MHVFDLEKEQEWNPKHHVEKILGKVAEGERILAAMDDMYGMLVTMDYPDAVTGNLRRSTDVARSLIEKTRGDLTTSIVQDQLRESIDRHSRLLGDGSS